MRRIRKALDWIDEYIFQADPSSLRGKAILIGAIAVIVLLLLWWLPIVTIFDLPPNHPVTVIGNLTWVLVFFGPYLFHLSPSKWIETWVNRISGWRRWAARQRLRYIANALCTGFFLAAFAAFGVGIFGGMHYGPAAPGLFSVLIAGSPLLAMVGLGWGLLTIRLRRQERVQAEPC